MCRKLCHFSFEVYDCFIIQKILKLWRQESWPFGPGWAAHITRLPSWTFRLPWWRHLRTPRNSTTPNVLMGTIIIRVKKILPLHLLKASRLLIIDAKCFNFCLATSFSFLPSSKLVLSKLISKLCIYINRAD